MFWDRAFYTITQSCKSITFFISHNCPEPSFGWSRNILNLSNAFWSLSVLRYFLGNAKSIQNTNTLFLLYPPPLPKGDFQRLEALRKLTQPWLTSAAGRWPRAVGVLPSLHRVCVHGGCLLKSTAPTKAPLDTWSSLRSLSASIPDVSCPQRSSLSSPCRDLGPLGSLHASPKPSPTSARRFSITAFPARWTWPG